jgi:hypothetical protein
VNRNERGLSRIAHFNFQGTKRTATFIAVRNNQLSVNQHPAFRLTADG